MEAVRAARQRVSLIIQSSGIDATKPKIVSGQHMMNVANTKLRSGNESNRASGRPQSAMQANGASKNPHRTCNWRTSAKRRGGRMEWAWACTRVGWAAVLSATLARRACAHRHPKKGATMRDCTENSCRTFRLSA